MDFLGLFVSGSGDDRGAFFPGDGGLLGETLGRGATGGGGALLVDVAELVEIVREWA